MAKSNISIDTWLGWIAKFLTLHGDSKIMTENLATVGRFLLTGAYCKPKTDHGYFKYRAEHSSDFSW